MAVDANTLAAIRAHIGTTDPPSDEDIGESWDRLGSVEAVALEVIRSRLADLLQAQPGSLSVDGDYAENWAANIAALERKEAKLAAAVAGQTGVVHVARLTRSGRSR